MSAIGLLPFQRALVALLRNAPTLDPLVGGRVYDAVPQDAPMPYVVLDECLETPDRTFGQHGHSLNLVLSIYTRDAAAGKSGRGSAGYGQGLAIAHAITALLLPGTMKVDGHDLTDVDVASIDCAREPDGITRRIDCEITALLEDKP